MNIVAAGIVLDNPTTICWANADFLLAVFPENDSNSVYIFFYSTFFPCGVTCRNCPITATSCLVTYRQVTRMNITACSRIIRTISRSAHWSSACMSTAADKDITSELLALTPPSLLPVSTPPLSATALVNFAILHIWWKDKGQINIMWLIWRFYWW